MSALLKRTRGADCLLPLLLLCFFFIWASWPSQAYGFSGRPEKAPSPSSGNGQDTQYPVDEYPAVLPDEPQGFSEAAGGLPAPGPENPSGPESLSISLKDVTLRVFYQERPKETPKISPKFREASFHPQKAANFSRVERLTGPLSEERLRYLQKNRFLLVPFEECSAARSKSMLEMFSLIARGKSHDDWPESNALFVGPDPFLHALHGYLTTRLDYLEQTVLSRALLNMLEGLYDNASLMRDVAGPEGAASFRRLQTQFLLPLAVLKSALPGGAGGVTVREQRLLEQQAKEFGTSLPASRERIIELLKTYDITEEDQALLEEELQAVFRADSIAPSILLARQYGISVPVDYGRFMPTGRHGRLPVLRSWHRAMQWLEAICWDMRGDASTMDAVNYALLMSMTPVKDAVSDIEPQPPCMYWQKIMEITAFFSGFASESAYPEWAYYLRTEMNLDPLGPDTASDAALLKRVQSGFETLKPFSPFFASVQRPGGQAALRVFPRRFSLPRFFQDELTRHPDHDRGKLPDLYSSLWAAAVTGNTYARELIPAQVEDCLLPQPAATPFYQYQAEREGYHPATPLPLMKEALNDAIIATQVGVHRLGILLQEEYPESWTSTLDSAWLHLLRTLTQKPGKGMPLYMQNPSFEAKQLESFLASLTERSGRRLLYDVEPVPHEAQTGEADDHEGWDEEQEQGVPVGFVEPNPVFWQGMIALTKSVEALFESHGLFSDDREPGGLLDSFINKLGLCATIAEKELKGKKISPLEYDTLREGLDLTFMVRSPEGEIDTSPAGNDMEDTEVLRLLQATNRHTLYGATGTPRLMLVLVGDGQNPRITVGVAYNHQEFVAGPQVWLSEGQWQQWNRAAAERRQGIPSLPLKPFWYDELTGK